MGIIRTKNVHNKNDSEVGIYRITGNRCFLQYIGERLQKFKKRIYEHQKDHLYKNLSNALCIQRNGFNHIFYFKIYCNY